MMTVFKRWTLFSAGAAWLFLAGIGGLADRASAQGWLLPEQPREWRTVPIKLESVRIQAKVVESLGEFEVRQVFRNTSGRAVEGTFYFPLPRGSQVTRFVLLADGKKIGGELLEKDRARRIYEEIVRKWRDPALLEFLHSDLFRARLFPVPPGGTREIRLRFVCSLPRQGDLYRLRYPLFQKRTFYRVAPFDTAADLVLDITLESKRGVQQVYSPTHKIEIVRKGPGKVRLGFEGKLGSIGRNWLELFYRLGQEPVGISVLSYRKKPEEGYFLLLASPRPDKRALAEQPKDLVFVLDVSGSMSGKKIRQAKAALKYCLQHLGPRDRFNLIAFSTESRAFRPDLQSADKVPAALRFLDSLEARGGTNIHDALLQALHWKPSQDRFAALVFLTDGRPTVGVTDDQEILKAVLKENARHIRIFVFGVGYDVNTFLVDQLAEKSGAAADYITPGEDIETVVTAFFDKVSTPLLTDVRLEWQGLSVSEVFPKQPPDLFRGTDLLVLGRYSKPGEGHVTLYGRNPAGRFEYSAPVTFVSGEDTYAFIPPLWASRKIGFLLDEIRLHGESQELVDEIVRLSKKFGIPTPYTSYLARESLPVAVRPAGPVPPAAPPSPSTPPWRMQNFLRAPGVVRYDAAGGKEGELAVTASKAIAAYKQTVQLGFLPAAKTVWRAGRAFTLRDSIWVEEGLANNRKVLYVRYAGPAYFWLAERFPQLIDILSLGERVRFAFRNVEIRIEPQPVAEQLDLHQLKKVLK